MTNEDINKKSLAQALRTLQAENECLQAALETLRDSEARVRNFMDNVGDGCFEFDLAGNITFCNEAMVRAFGCSREELLGMRRAERHPGREEAREVFRMFESMIRKNIPETLMEYRIMRRDGQIRDVEAVIALIYDAAGRPTGFRGIGRDITERKKIERERERYREFVENVNDICAEYDLKGRCTFCNEAACRVFGYDRETLLQLHHHERYPNREEADKIFRAVHETYIKKLPVNYVDARVRCRGGEVRVLETAISMMFDASGTPVGFRSIARDVTQRRKMERDLERYRDFLESVEDSCAEFDLRGRCTFCNEAACRMLGYTRKEYMQLRHHQRYESSEEVRQVFEVFNEIYKTGKPAKLYTSGMRCKDGSSKTLESIVTLICDAQGHPTGFRNIARDLTARKKMEEEQQRLRDQLAEARKMEAVGTLAGGVAHDFNNLLMGIQGYASLMLLDTDVRHPHYGQLRAIEAHVRSGADLTRQLLGYARGGRYEVKPLDLNDVISRSAEMFGRTKKEIVMTQDLEEKLWTVDADRSQMDQVLLNLFVNAWHAMPEGGEIFIRTQNIRMEAFQAQSLGISPGPYVQISVRDTGVGMDEITRERLFEPFYTTKEMGQIRGAGLGLASVYGIVKGHGGAIEVESDIGRGATFSIYLPASFNEIEEERSAEDVTLPGRESILLVDDEKSITDVIVEMLSGLGYRVMTAQSGEEAIDLYRLHAGEIDLVIMDMIMPGLGGRAAIAEIRKMNPQARIILSSGYALAGQAQEILDQGGAVLFLQKPFHVALLSRKIREALDQPLAL